MPLIDAHAVKYDATGQTVTDYGPPGGPKGRIRMSRVKHHESQACRTIDEARDYVLNVCRHLA